MAALALFLVARSAAAEPVKVVADEQGMQLVVAGKPMMVFGMNWDYQPIGENYSYDFWGKPDAFIEEALATDMSLLKAMGVNTIRQYDSIPPRWVEWIYDHYGIYTAVNNLMGRYGHAIDGVWTANIDYANPVHRKALLDELEASVKRYAGRRGVLMWMLGNESNYGLSWTSFEIEALPVEGSDPRAVHLYTLMNEAAELVHRLDGEHPVSLTNGDIQYLDIIKTVCPAFDIFGTNVYRGESGGDIYRKVFEATGKPLLYSEFGADAFDAKEGREDDVAQAGYLLKQWKDIYRNAHGNGGVGNAIGGFVFQWTDGWWKTGQEIRLDIHDKDASWPNGGYPHDFVAGQNNMNEEWFGITAKSVNDSEGHYSVRPRTSYYALQEAFALDPYGTSRAALDAHFDGITPASLGYRYAALRAESETESLQRLRLSNLRMVFDSSVSAGEEATGRAEAPAFGHTESFWADVEAEPAKGVWGKLSLNAVGGVAGNRLDDLFYEQRALAADGSGDVTDRVAVYGAEVKVEAPLATIKGYYRTGHTHWGYEGDFFGLYRETYYGPNLDTYKAGGPLGFELDGKGALSAFDVALGPEIYWGANPMVIGKYSERFGALGLTLMHQEDLLSGGSAESSFAAPERRNRKSALSLDLPLGAHRLQLGGLMSGTPRMGERFTYVEPVEGRGYLDSGYDYVSDEVQLADTLAGRARLTMDFGRAKWLVQGSYHGLVAEGGEDRVVSWQRWSLQESGRGNHYALSSGLAVSAGSLTVAPKALYQVPLVGPNPKVDAVYSPQTGIFYPGIAPRDVLGSPFAVLDNRETVGGELLLVWDPTPASWYWQWDRDDKERGPLSASLDLVYRHQPTSRDANLAVLENGAVVPFGGAPEASDAWDATLELFSEAGPVRLHGSVFAGLGQARGDSEREVFRKGFSLTADWSRVRLLTRLHLDDWGPYDYDRDFNLTYPMQWYGDLSWGVKAARLNQLDTRVGLRGQVRVADADSPGWVGAAGVSSALEYESGFYLQFGL